MFILYAPLIGLAIGLLLGGRLARLGAIRFRWLPAVLLAIAIQGPLFGPLQDFLPAGAALGIGLYIATSLMALAAVLRNVALPGMALVAVGAAANLAAIVANGGVMPASADALAALGWSGASEHFANSALVASAALPWLTDIFALPSWLPFANVFSPGDVAIGIGIAAFMSAGMMGAGRPLLAAPARPEPVS
jgi:hypothetical protein